MTSEAQGGSVRCSVIIPCRNAAGTIGRQLAALYHQDFEEPFEVVVADNESTDGSGERAMEWADRLPRLKVVQASPAGANVARNAGVRASSGELLVFCDSDDQARPDWLREISAAFESDVDLVGGALDWGPLNPQLSPERRRLQTELPNTLGFLPWVEGTNFAVRRKVWEQLGGFDESYVHGGDDVEFPWRAQLAGFRLVAAPGAIMNYEARNGALATFRQSTHYGRSHVRLFETFQADGMPRSPVRALIGRCWWLTRNSPRALRPGEGREAFLRRAGITYGRLTTSVKRRTRYF